MRQDSRTTCWESCKLQAKEQWRSWSWCGMQRGAFSLWDSAEHRCAYLQCFISKQQVPLQLSADIPNRANWAPFMLCQIFLAVGAFSYAVMNFPLKAPWVFASTEPSFSLHGTNQKGLIQMTETLDLCHKRPLFQYQAFFVPTVTRRNNTDHINGKAIDSICKPSRQILNNSAKGPLGSFESTVGAQVPLQLSPSAFLLQLPKFCNGQEQVQWLGNL